MTINMDKDFVLMLVDFGENGTAFVETAPADATYDRAVEDIMTGQYENVRKVVRFNPVEGWSQDITKDIFREVEARRERERFEYELDHLWGERADDARANRISAELRGAA